MDSVREKIEDLIRKIIKSISSSDEMRHLIKQKDLNYDDSLRHIQQLKVYSILESKVMDRVM